MHPDKEFIEYSIIMLLFLAEIPSRAAMPMTLNFDAGHEFQVVSRRIGLTVVDRKATDQADVVMADNTDLTISLLFW